MISVCSSDEFEGYSSDGWYNNMNNPEWGASDTRLLRTSQAAYSDGVYGPSGQTRPNPFDISKAVHHGPAGLPSYRNANTQAQRTAMLVYFGQQVVEEIVDSQGAGCPIEYFNVPVPRGHHTFHSPDKSNVEMPFKRTRYDQRTGYSPNNPRQQLNEVTPFLDGQVIYGPSKAWTDAIRSFKGGRLASTNPGNIQQQFPVNNSIRLPFANPPVARNHKLEPVSRFHAIGNPRGHENPFLLSIGILWFRWHNFIADRVAIENSSFTDEQVFNIARKRVIALYQKVVFYDWLPVWLDTSVPPSVFKSKYPYKQSRNVRKMYNGYNPSVHPGIVHEFQAAAMRFGHTLVTPGLWSSIAKQVPATYINHSRDLIPDGIYRHEGERRGNVEFKCLTKGTIVTATAGRTGNCNFLPSRVLSSRKQYAALRLCNSYWNSRETVEEDLDALFRGLASTISEREDSIMVPDLTESLFGPLEFSKRDLAALNIQRGRDHGITDYNSVRESYGLKRIKKWENINPSYNTEQIKRLRRLYKGNDTRPDNIDLFTGGLLETTPKGPGELFHTIILEQFLRIRHGDRFWFENKEQSGLTSSELDEIWNTQLVDMVTAVTGIQAEIQRNLFIFTDADRVGCLEQPKQLNTSGTFGGVDMLEPCTQFQTYDYFNGSEVSFALTFLVVIVCIPLTYLTMYLLSRCRRSNIYKTRCLPPPLQRTSSSNVYEFRAVEWIDMDELDRVVIVVLEPTDGRIDVFSTQMLLLRYVDICQAAKREKGPIEFHLSSDRAENVVGIKLQEYDLVLKFYNSEERTRFMSKCEVLLSAKDVRITQRYLVESYILHNVNTKKHRQEKLNKFFRKILNMFQEGELEDVDENIYGPLDNAGNELARIELTQTEFGEAFGMKPTSTFVKHMFLLVDADKSGRVSFKEFLDIFILLSSDDTDSKTRLLFNMYDMNRHGYLTRDDLYQMIRSLLDLSENNVTDGKVAEFASAVYLSAGLRLGTEITFTDFRKVFATGNYARTLKNATLELNATNDDDEDQATFHKVPSMGSKMSQRRSTLIRGYSISAQGTLSSGCGEHNLSMSGRMDKYSTFARSSSQVSRLQMLTDTRSLPHTYARIVAFLEMYKLHVFWLTLYVLVTAGIFTERAYYYAMERENSGLRRITGHGVTMSRGSASVIMFSYAGLILTMCKNLITSLRETVLHRFIPFDSFHTFHKIIACVSLVFTVMHIFFHGINLYQICTQPSTDLICYFREYYRASHEFAHFHYWAFGTTTGLSGIIVTILLIVLFVFALPFARRHLFHVFWNTHKLYLVIYILILLHGSARMVQDPHFPYYVIGPVILFTIDKLISVSRATLELTVIKAELLPSDVTSLTVIKPPGFEYKSGQWAQVACVSLGEREFHPFTMTSSPHEKYLTFHIRAVGPWTNNIRRLFDPSIKIGASHSKLLLDGPFGEGHQDWYRYEVSVLIGGGIGVTPFVSILKDIVHKSQMAITMQCKKVYFLWVTRTQKQFEWVTDIIRELESVDQLKMVTTHIFVTQFKSKFDLRTSMLYICERHFQKIAGKSLFTGLAAITHFGRPRFYHFLESLRYEHKQVKRLGIFSCGPRPMTLTVERACTELNKYQSPTYYHHYENF